MKNLTKLDKEAETKIYCSMDDYYVSEPDLLIHRYRTSIDITYMANAMKKGKKCFRLSVSGNRNEETIGFEAFFAGIEDKLDTLKIMADIDGKEYGKIFENEHISVHYSLKDSYHIFHPTRFKAMLNPVKEMPAKLTLSHIYRIIAHGQYDYLKCNGVYTDDYAFDAAYNFQQGELDSVSFLERIYNRPSGWWCSPKPYSNGGAISVCCHSFDSNSILINLSKGGKAA